MVLCHQILLRKNYFFVFLREIEFCILLVPALRAGGAEGSFAFTRVRFSPLEICLLSCFPRSDRRGFGGEHNRVSKFRPAFQKVSNFLIWIAARILERHQIQPSIQASQILKEVVYIYERTNLKTNEYH